MAMASLVKVILGSIAFSIFWVMAVFPSVPFLPIGRTAGSLLGAMLMVLFRVITPEQAFAAVDLPILGLLFGTMVVSVYLERADMFKYLGKLLSWKSRGAKDLLCRICLVSAVSASLFTNDTACVVLTEFVLKVARRHDLPPHPFLLALASSANIGSAATPIGNPQNLVIAVQSGIPFGRFLRGVAPAMLVGVTVNAAVLLACYWKVLTVKKAPDEPTEGADAAVEDVSSRHRFSPATLTHFSSATNLDLDGWVPNDKIETLTLQSSPNIIAATERLRHRLNSATENEIQRVLSEAQQNHHLALDVNCMNNGGNPNRVVSVNGFTDSNASSVKPRTNNNNNSNNNINLGIGTRMPEKWKTVVWKCCVYSVTVGMLVALLSGLDMSWTAITAALALVVLDFQDAQQCLEKVSYSLLIFFCGMFVTVDGFNKTGIPSTLWETIEPYAKIDHPAGIAILALVILGLCNLASNVPTVLLLGARVAASAAVISEAQEKRAWLILAWVGTVAGNLSLLGSAANLIVCEQARRAPELGYNLTFWTHLKFGLPSTLIVTAIGLTFIR